MSYFTYISGLLDLKTSQNISKIIECLVATYSVVTQKH